MPRDAVQDTSSAALAGNLLDGLHYIVGCATDATRRIVVNISDGSSRGSHDGESLIELAMDISSSDREARIGTASFASSCRAATATTTRATPNSVCLREARGG